MVSIHSIIGAVQPNVYCKESQKEVIEIVEKDKDGVLAGARYIEKLKKDGKDILVKPEFLDLEKAEISNAWDLKGLKNPLEQHKLGYDAVSESLEPVYFWLLDNLEEEYGAEPKKLIDTFASSYGSGHFSEMGQKATTMQQQGMQMLGAINQVVKSIINLIYDLKEFKMRLELYEHRTSEKPEEKEGALLSLKQVWLDTVDIKRGNSSIKAMAISGANAPNFVTLIDGFMAIIDLKTLHERHEEGKLDLNDRVYRLLEQRFAEFEIWLDKSYQEIKKRFEIEKAYLKSQVSTVKLYARWAKPYLEAAKRLEQNASRTSALVNSFNSSILELTLFSSKEHLVKEDVDRNRVPKMYLDKVKEKYQECVVVELKFTTIPEKTSQQGGYGFRGRVGITFTSYSLSTGEIELMSKAIEKDDFDEAFGAISGSTDETLNALKGDLDELLGEKEEEKKDEKKEEKKSDDSNPFSALFSIFLPSTWQKKEEKKPSDPNAIKVKKDDDFEKVARNYAIISARGRCNKMYSSYKGSHGMATLP